MTEDTQTYLSKLLVFTYKGHPFRYKIVDRKQDDKKSIDIVDNKLVWTDNRNYEFRYYLFLYSDNGKHYREVKFNEWGIEQEEKLMKLLDSAIEVMSKEKAEERLSVQQRRN